MNRNLEVALICPKFCEQNNEIVTRTMSLAKIPDAVLPTTPEHRVESTAVKVPPLKVRAPKIISVYYLQRKGKRILVTTNHECTNKMNSLS